MAASFSFDPGLVFDDVSLTPSASATGVLLDQPGGTAQQVYDLNGNPLDHLSSNSRGYVARFKAGIGIGYISFGSILQPVVSMEVLQSGPAADQAATTAATAQQNAANALSAANTAAAASQAAQVAAQNAAAAAQAAADAAQSGGGGTGGLPAGTTLDAIPNGTTRVAMTTQERDKLATVAVGATNLQIGTTATTAKAGNYQPTPAQIGAVQTMSGATRVWVRTTAQGLPSAAEGALDGDLTFMDAS